MFNIFKFSGRNKDNKVNDLIELEFMILDFNSIVAGRLKKKKIPPGLPSHNLQLSDIKVRSIGTGSLQKIEINN